MSGSEKAEPPQLRPYGLAYASVHLAVDLYPLRSFVIKQSSNESTDFLSSRSHQSKLIVPKEEVMGTSDL